MTVATNAPSWWVECQASPLVSEEDEVPVSRMLWEKLDGSGNVLDAGNLGENAVVLQGNTPTEGTESILRYKMRITMEDVAGIYRGTISLVGIVGE